MTSNNVNSALADAFAEALFDTPEEPTPKAQGPTVCWTTYNDFCGPRWTEEDLQRMHGLRRR